MPFYEMALVLRPAHKEELLACLKRTAKLIWNEFGSISKIEYLGTNPLPHKLRNKNDGNVYNTGSYFIYHISLGEAKLPKIRPELKLDVDLMKANFYVKDQSKIDPNYVCTLDEELLPPVYRKSVQPLLNERNFRAEVRK